MQDYDAIEEFAEYLKNERKSSDNTIASYTRDMRQLSEYLDSHDLPELLDVNDKQLGIYIDWLRRAGLADEELQRCRDTIRIGKAFLTEHPENDLFHATVEELLFRAELEENALAGNPPPPDAMKKLERYEADCRERHQTASRPVDAAERETLRFQALRDYLAAFGENGN